MSTDGRVRVTRYACQGDPVPCSMHSYCGECRRVAQVIKRSAARFVAAALAA